MSYFEYKQYRINEIIENIESLLERQGKEKPINEYGYFRELSTSMVEYYPAFPEIVQEKLIEAIYQLKIAMIYTQRVDKFLSGDDGEETFLKKLEEDLINLQ